MSEFKNTMPVGISLGILLVFSWPRGRRGLGRLGGDTQVLPRGTRQAAPRVDKTPRSACQEVEGKLGNKLGNNKKAGHVGWALGLAGCWGATRLVPEDEDSVPDQAYQWARGQLEGRSRRAESLIDEESVILGPRPKSQEECLSRAVTRLGKKPHAHEGVAGIA
ncbi:hypothetical protein EDB81DRAFT_159264 [Dactylonectria macrodidyma]|uniref:Uncharacterized protein n=1 Tax=Dactylonectria macrodidyma TaxID=307937 RepID=A0A9P9JP04_9HYPO|nr:hypothetical protein EDB81DRAFT_159264 [Dactylonectria macrodidyma]